jgi:Tol biopolymer transport system component
MLWASIAVVLTAVAGVIWFLARPPVTQTRMQFAMAVSGEVSHMALSWDGSMLVFVSPEANSGLPMLYVQRVGTPSAALLPGTEGASYPFWSPDGTNVAFFANGKLQKMAISGGTPQVLANVSAARGGSWGRRNVIIYSPAAGSAIWRVNADGTGAVPVTDGIMAPSVAKGKQDATHRWATFLPDGNHFLFWAGNFGDAKDDRSSGIYASSLDGKEKKLLVLCRSSFGYDLGHLFYADEQQRLVSVALDASTATVSGSTNVLANVVGFEPSTYWTAITVSEKGTLIYDDSSGAALSALTWMDRTGKELGRLGEPAVMCNPTLSPDGRLVALDISDQKANNVDVWLESTTGAGNSRFTFNPEEDVVGVWSRDGKTIAYRSNRASGTELFTKRSTGLEQEKPLLQVPSTDDLVPNSWSLDDQQILGTRMSASGSRLELIPAAGGSPTPFLTSKGSETNGMISPDGKWVAYASDESGNWEIYVTTFPNAAGKWQVSRGGGTEPRWRGDGGEIFYIATKGMLMAAQVNSGAGFSTVTPAPLFQIHGRASISSSDVFTYDVTKDGKRFLVNRYVKPDRITLLTIVLHAAAEQQH